MFKGGSNYLMTTGWLVCRIVYIILVLAKADTTSINTARQSAGALYTASAAARRHLKCGMLIGRKYRRNQLGR